MAATLETEPAGAAARAGFVGRARELAKFTNAFLRMLEGRRQILTLAGEPGIGKTRLAEAMAVQAEDHGALVLWGRCFEEPGAPPYWPWVQILREFVQASSPTELRLLLGTAPSEISALVPELSRVTGSDQPAEPVSQVPGQARFETFDAIGGFVRRAADRVPLVLLIDNAHWADKASLALLEFLSAQLLRSRLLVVCTYRDTEIMHSNPLLTTLGAFGGGDGISHLRLKGLDTRAIAELADSLLDRSLPEEIIQAIDHQTDGNPLFVIELLKVLIDESREAGIEPIEVRIPDGVRETIGRRLSRLPEDVIGLLRAASVIGREFESAVLARVAGVQIEHALGLLDLAERAGFVECVDSSSGTHCFTHALIRETLYEEISTHDRLRLHGLTGDALVALFPVQALGRLSRIAHHFYESAALGHAGQAADYAARAGHEAMRLGAYEEADNHFGHIMSLQQQHGLGDDTSMRQAASWKSEALISLGDEAAATSLLIGSLSDGDPLADAESQADVATQWVLTQSTGIQLEQLQWLRHILERLPDGDGSARARVLAAQAFAERTLGARARVLTLVDEALAMARRLGDADALRYCLNIGSFALGGRPDSLGLRLELGSELLALSPVSDQVHYRGKALKHQASNLLEAGRISEFEHVLNEHESLKVARVGLNEYWTKSFRITLDLLQGRYRGLELRIDELQEIGHKMRSEDADGVHGAQMFALHRDLGRLQELAPIIERFAASPIQRAWTPGLMLALTELGKLDAARRSFDSVAAASFDAVPNDDLRATSLVYCAETCAALGDAERAKTLYQLLLPYAGTFVNHPTAVCLGSTDLYLGMLAAAAGRIDTARTHFEEAQRANTAGRAWPWVARTCYWLAVALLGSEDPDDRPRAEQELREAEQIAGSLGMQALAASISRLLRGEEADSAYPDELTAREVEVLKLLAIGRSNKDIAKVLSISLNTVATHVRNILTKTECANRTEAAVYASSNQLID